MTDVFQQFLRRAAALEKLIQLCFGSVRTHCFKRVPAGFDNCRQGFVGGQITIMHQPSGKYVTSTSDATGAVNYYRAMPLLRILQKWKDCSVHHLGVAKVEVLDRCRTYIVLSKSISIGIKKPIWIVRQLYVSEKTADALYALALHEGDPLPDRFTANLRSGIPGPLGAKNILSISRRGTEIVKTHSPSSSRPDDPARANRGLFDMD
jgi:hypothetical protein